MFCKYCGKQLSDDAEFCSGCGRPTGVKRVVTRPSQPAAGNPASGTYPARPAQNQNQGSVPPGYTGVNTGYSAPRQSVPTQRTYGPQGGYRNAGGYAPQGGYSPQGGYQNAGYGYQNPYQQPVRKRKSPLLWIIAGLLVIALLSGVAGNFFGTDDSYSSHYGHHYYSGGNNNSSGSGSTSTPTGTPTATGTGIYSTDLPTAGLRNFYVNTANAQSATVMIYMVGSNLESQNGCGTADLIEIANANFGDNVNVVVQTGGTTYWKNDVMDDGTVQRWEVKNGKFTELEDLGKQRMLVDYSLSDFITFAADEYPADRYILIMWDHGGGSLYGFGYDELYTNDTMFLTNIYSALKMSNVKFDFIGFDACLMATVETALAMEPFADYLIASEETEPGGGWYYTNWLTELSRNTSINTVELGRMIVDDFIEHSTKDDTLSVVSLREIPRVYKELSSFLENARSTVLPMDYTIISTARANAKAYADGEYDLVDILDFSGRVTSIDSEALSEAIASAVKYRNNCAIQGSCGLSMYFPYTDLDVYSYARNIFSQVGYSGSCLSFFDDFVNVMVHGQVPTYRTTGDDSVTVYESGVTDYSGEEWYDATVITHDTTTFSIQDRMELVLGDDGKYVLAISDEDWDAITSILLEAMYDDGEGYIYLGSDQYFTLDDDDNLIVDYDNTWVALNGRVVVYYASSIQHREDGTSVFTGVVPAVLNDDTDIEIMLKYDAENPGGYVEGYRYKSDDSNVQSRNYLQFEEGDKIDFTCSYYKYDGTYDADYILTDKTIVYDPAEGLTTSYEDVGPNPVRICYRLTDIYCNEYWTEELIYR
ncbi:MAG: zinc-ribbon domain-containing protein [Eubacteriaceae bacterium]|nr:zinc-ribbon domain-containing protein [Eubacteriaceae bacterium]